MTSSQHIRSAFDRDLEMITSKMLKMGGLVESSIIDAAEAFESSDLELAQNVRKRDKKIDDMVKSVGSANIINALDKTTNMKNLELSRDKLELALKYVDRIVNEQQQKEVKNLFDVQLKLINQLINMSPLINEFKDVLKTFDKN